uniref:Uncharacterized protein n=1 Tax=Ciona savignyi TaxID=51511 RepID=H2YP68_CIOSA
MTTFVNSAPMTVTSPAATNRGNNYAKAFQTLGILQILLGSLSIFTWSYTLAFAVSGYYIDAFAYVSAGIWCGIFFLVAGILAFVSSVDPNNCKIVSGMVMSIFAAIFAVTMFAIEVAGAVLVPYSAYRYSYYSYCRSYYQPSYYKASIYVPTCYSSSSFGSGTYRPSRYISGVYLPSKYIPCYNSYPRNSSGSTGMSTLHGFMAFFAFAELIIAITHAVYCCKYKSLTNMVPATTTVQYTTTYQQPITHQMPVTSIGHPAGMPVTTTYPAVGSVPYQNYPTPIYANHQANMASQQSVNTTATIPTVSQSGPPTYME